MIYVNSRNLREKFRASSEAALDLAHSVVVDVLEHANLRGSSDAKALWAAREKARLALRDYFDMVDEFMKKHE